MGARPLLSALVSWLWLGAGSVQAGTLTSATWTQTVSAPVNVGLTLTRTTAQLGATGSSTATSISVGLSFPAFATSVFEPNTPMLPIGRHLRFTQGGPQTISATQGDANATPPIQGTAVVMNATHASMGVNQSMFMIGQFTLLSVPLQVGVDGQFTNTFAVLGQLGVMTVDFFAWTPGTLTFKGLTYKLSPLPDVIAMGSFALTANGGGTVTLVSPSRITARSPVIFESKVVSLTTLTLSFVPEAGTLLLLAASAVALSHGARRRS